MFSKTLQAVYSALLYWLRTSTQLIGAIAPLHNYVMLRYISSAADNERLVAKQGHVGPSCTDHTFNLLEDISHTDACLAMQRLM